uniref:Secreted protein n=1 Tax=Steinernema glaseri TaxID=37863 RepID=A0A1I7ZAK3_9BILA
MQFLAWIMTILLWLIFAVINCEIPPSGRPEVASREATPAARFLVLLVIDRRRRSAPIDFRRFAFRHEFVCAITGPFVARLFVSFLCRLFAESERLGGRVHRGLFFAETSSVVQLIL